VGDLHKATNKGINMYREIDRDNLVVKLFYHPGPNPVKVALFLEEADLPYEIVPIDIKKGDQHTPEFVSINPNAKTPAIVDGDVTVFDSNAILLYLADKTGQFLPEDTLPARGQLLSWLLFIASGVGPYVGQAIFFKHMAPDPKGVALERYMYEAERHFQILETHLSNRRYMLGDTYTIVDMAAWGWTCLVPRVMGEDGWARFPELLRHNEEISARPAAQRVKALKDQHAFKIEMDEAAWKHMFRKVSFNPDNKIP